MQVIVDRQRGATWDESRSSRTCRLQVVLSSYSVESTPTDDVFTASRKCPDERQVLVSTKVIGGWLSAKKEWEEERKTRLKFSAGLLLVKLGLAETPATSHQPKRGLTGQRVWLPHVLALPQPQRWPLTLHNPSPPLSRSVSFSCFSHCQGTPLVYLTLSHLISKIMFHA